MNAPGARSWLKPVILSAVAYLAIGVASSELAGRAPSNQGRVAWRLAAWLVSAVVFGAHINSERLRPGSTPALTALRAALGAALGAFGLAAAAIVHTLSAGKGNRGLLAIALVAWPMLTAVPAFLVALAVAAGLARRKPPA